MFPRAYKLQKHYWKMDHSFIHSFISKKEFMRSGQVPDPVLKVRHRAAEIDKVPTFLKFIS